MPRKIKPAQGDGLLRLRQCREALLEALEEARLAECPSLVKKIQSALKSHGGAVRHMKHRLMRTPCDPAS